MTTINTTNGTGRFPEEALDNATPLGVEDCKSLKDKMPAGYEAWRTYEREVLRPAERKAKEGYDTEVNLLTQERADVNAENQRLDLKIMRAQDEREIAIAPLQEDLREGVRALQEAHDEAATRAAHAGRLYDPTDPRACLALMDRPEPPHIQSDSALGEAEPREDPVQAAVAQFRIPARLGWILLAGNGATLGTSFGLMAGLYDPSNLERHWLALILTFAIGVAASVYMRYACANVALYAGRRTVEGTKSTDRLPLAFAVLVAGLCVATEATVEMSGILKLAARQEILATLSGAPQGDHSLQWPVLAAGVLISLGFIVYSAMVGYMSGRDAASRAQKVERDQSTAEAVAFPEPSGEKIGADAPVQDTGEQALLLAVSKVWIRLGQITDLKKQMSDLCAEYDERIGTLETSRRSLPMLSAAAQVRISDLEKEALGKRQEWESLYKELLKFLKVSGHD